MSIKIEIEVQEAQAILDALAKLPLEKSLDLWLKIKTQAEQQLHAQQAPQPSVAQAPADAFAEPVTQ
jgi:hypothetical protein